MHIDKPYLTPSEVAARLAISRRHTYRLIETGALRAHKFGVNAIRVHVDDLAEYEADACA